MGMTIEESLNNLKNLQEDYQQFHDDIWQDPESHGIIAESLQVAVDAVSKYQKIEQIIDDWENSGEEDDPVNIIINIEEVLEDGNDSRRT